MSAVIDIRRDLASPLEAVARIARLDAAHKARMTRLQQITEANHLRRLHGIRTTQELQRVIENAVAACDCQPGSSMWDWRQRLVDLLCDMECDGVGEEA